jgi:hypothetical protein
VNTLEFNSSLYWLNYWAWRNRGGKPNLIHAIELHDLRKAPQLKPSIYDVLGINSDSTGHEIKEAYRVLAFRYHPDLNHDPEASTRMKEINLAFAECMNRLINPMKHQSQRRADQREQNTTKTKPRKERPEPWWMRY